MSTEGTLNGGSSNDSGVVRGVSGSGSIIDQDNQEKKKPRSRGLGVFASCCCCDGGGTSEEEDGTKVEHEVIIPKPRGCTDCAYLIVYIMFCCILLLIGVFAFVYGNPLRLINGMDSFGNVCGTTNVGFDDYSLSGQDMSDRPYVFFFNLHDMDTSKRICVQECPSTVIDNMEGLINFYEERNVNLCQYNFNITNQTDNLSSLPTSQLDLKVSETDCPNFPIYSSLPILKRCIPDPTSKLSKGVAFANIYEYLNSLNIFKQILGDLAVTWVSVLVLTSFSFVISFALIILLHWMTALISYFIMIITALICVGFTAFMWWTYASIKMQLDSTDRNMLLNEIVRNESAFLSYSIISTIFTFLLVLIVVYLRNRVRIVVRLFREAGSALIAMPCLVIQPFLTYLSLTAFFCVWLYIVLCLATADEALPKHVPFYPLSSSGESDFIFNTSSIVPALNDTIEVDTTSNDTDIPEAQSLSQTEFPPQFQAQGNGSVSLSSMPTFTIIEYSGSIWVKYLWWIYIFGLIWCSEFILACQQMVIASSVAAWYFSRNRAQLRCVIMESIFRLIKYHLGSVALGSLLITLVKVPRLILKFADRVLRKWDDYKWARWLNACCLQCLCCFERCMRYVHHNAYTVIAIQGVGFCPAAKLAFSALVQNALQISVINSIGDCILFLAKCTAALLTGLIAVVYFQQDDRLYFYAIPVLLTIIFAYFVAHCVISVFEMAVDTLFLCFCEDHNMHYDSTDGQQFYAPSTLLRYMTIDAVDALAADRRQSSLSSYKNSAGGADVVGSGNSKIAQISAQDRQSFPEETIPMNPYGNPTTERIED